MLECTLTDPENFREGEGEGEREGEGEGGNREIGRGCEVEKLT